MWRTHRAASETARPTTPTTTGRSGAVRQQHSAPDDTTAAASGLYDVHRIGAAATESLDRDLHHHEYGHHHFRRAQLSPPSSSTASNATAPAIDSPTRKRKQLAISNAFFGPSSQATDIYFETDQEDHDANMHEYYYEHSDDDDISASNSHKAAFAPPPLASAATNSPAPPQQQPPTAPASASNGNSGAPGSGSNASLDANTTAAAAAAAATRRRRKANQEQFKRLARLTDAQQPVSLRAFTHKPSRHFDRASTTDATTTSTAAAAAAAAAAPHHQSHYNRHPSRRLNTELLEAYVAYARSIGREPQIDATPSDLEASEASTSDREAHDIVAGRTSILQPRVPVVAAPRARIWTQYIGTRHSKQRGCVQFWLWLLIGVVVSIIMAFFLAHLALNDVLHLDAFVEQNVVITDDFAFLHLRDEVSFRIKYDIASEPMNAGDTDGSSEFQVLLLYEDEFEKYVEGEVFRYIEQGSTLRTTTASLPLTHIENEEYDDVYFVVQPCRLKRNVTLDYCDTTQLPTPVSDGRKIFKLDGRSDVSAAASVHALAIRRLYVNPMPNDCSASGWTGGSYLLLFLPFVALSLFGLRIPQMLYHREGFRANLTRKYTHEATVPENEVDYWQPMPWDRKVPKTRLLGPCCWRKMRKPFEPFYTWWRHENYFTWIFCPYRNERLARGERAIIVFCSLYLTFYVLFVLVMLRDKLGANLTLIASVLIYYVLIMILPSLGKAIFKELFKLIFRQRRKYFRVRAAAAAAAAAVAVKTDSNINSNSGSSSSSSVDETVVEAVDDSGFSFRLAFVLQVLATLCIALTQVPMFYIWLYRSCTFLKQFMYFGVLAAVTRLSVLGLIQDYIWYLVIKTWGWRDLCPYCTERLVHCDCFNDELLVLSVERVGPKWDLILLLDAVLAKQASYPSQFDQYTAEQLRERWQILVDRATLHMAKVEKLRALEAKKRQDALRRAHRRTSLVAAASFLGLGSRGDSAINEREDRCDPATAEATTSKLKSKHRRSSDDDDDGARTASDEHDDEQQQQHTDDSDSDAAVDAAVTEQVGCCLRERKVLALDSEIALNTFEKHYDSTIVDVFHALHTSLSKRRKFAKRAWRKHRRHERREEEEEDARNQQQSSGNRSSDDGATRDTAAIDLEAGDWRFDRPSAATEEDDARGHEEHARIAAKSSSSSGETMWVFDSPQQRLEVRARERLRRKRAFRVLDNYFVEAVASERDAHGNVHYVPATTTTVSGASHAADSASSAHRSTATALPISSASSSTSLRRTDSLYAKLLLPRQRSLSPCDDDVVVVAREPLAAAAAPLAVSPVHVTCVRDNDSSSSSSDASDSDADEQALSIGSRRRRQSSNAYTSERLLPPPAAPQSRTYAVIERKPSLLRQVSSNATSLASWVFKLDKRADV